MPVSKKRKTTKPTTNRGVYAEPNKMPKCWNFDHLDSFQIHSLINVIGTISAMTQVAPGEIPDNDKGAYWRVDEDLQLEIDWSGIDNLRFIAGFDETEEDLTENAKVVLENVKDYFHSLFLHTIH